MGPIIGPVVSAHIDLRTDLVGDAIERPAHRVGNHRDRFGQPDVPHGPGVHPGLELLGREASANLLLEG